MLGVESNGLAAPVSATPACSPPPAPTAGNNSPLWAGLTLNLTASSIPGATYNVMAEASGHAGIEGEPFKVEPGRPVRLADFRLPASDREVRGIVVDPQGKPLSGIYVGYQPNGVARPPLLRSPYRLFWSQNTDATGRFHLTGLPRGPIWLRADAVNLDPPRLDVRTSTSIEVPPGQAEVRFELLAPYGRLRGIE